MNDKIKILQTSENSFIELAKTLGKPISSRRDKKIIDELTPKKKRMLILNQFQEKLD